MDTRPPQTIALDAMSGTDRQRACEALVARIARRDVMALVGLYRLTHRPVHRRARDLLQDECDAEEVTDDVYLQVWQQATSYSTQRGTVMAWLMNITRSRAIDHLRQVEAASRHIDRDVDPHSLVDASAHEDDPDVLWNTRWHHALLKLKAPRRQMLTLAFLQGLSHREIGLHVRLPLGTVKTHIRRGLDDLRAELRTMDVDVP
jgi:RNA polymerase sigma-70 factor (ECF subfamily)